MNHNQAKIRVKLKSLACEAKIIRKDEIKAKRIAQKLAKKRGMSVEDSIVRQSLYLHRIHVLRPEARAAHLAYAFMRNKSYASTEIPRDEHSLTFAVKTRVQAILKKYHSYDITMEDVQEWIDGAESDIVTAKILERNKQAFKAILGDKTLKTAAYS